MTEEGSVTAEVRNRQS